MFYGLTEFNMFSNEFNKFSDNYQNENGLKINNTEDLKLKVINYRNRFRHLFLFRYFEMIPNMIKYDFKEDEKYQSIDWLKVEVALRNNFRVIIGENSEGYLNFLGYTNAPKDITSPTSFFEQNTISIDDINFIIPFSYRPTELKQITRLDNCTTGNFVVLDNKVYNFINDNLMIYHYAETLAEIVASRFSLIIQAKALTIFRSNIGDETMNQVINDIYNGAAFIQTSMLFDKEDSMLNFDNTALAQNLTELKREYQNQFNELNSIIGADVLGVDKESGVSDFEAQSGNPFSQNISNIYLDARQTPLDNLTKRYGGEITVQYDNNVQAEFMKDFNAESGEINESDSDVV